MYKLAYVEDILDYADYLEKLAFTRGGARLASKFKPAKPLVMGEKTMAAATRNAENNMRASISHAAPAGVTTSSTVTGGNSVSPLVAGGVGAMLGGVLGRMTAPKATSWATKAMIGAGGAGLGAGAYGLYRNLND